MATSALRAGVSSSSSLHSPRVQHIEYAASHGPDLVVIMGEEIVVPVPGAQNAGRRVHRRFTDVFRKENGEWRFDLRHANVISID